MKDFKIYRNIPFVDNRATVFGDKKISLKMFFYFQRGINRRWLELPFIGLTWNKN